MVPAAQQADEPDKVRAANGPPRPLQVIRVLYGPFGERGGRVSGDDPWAFYFLVKIILYVSLVWQGFRGLNPGKAASTTLVGVLGVLRLLMGLLMAVPLFAVGMRVFNVFGEGTVAMIATYLLLYPATRWIEWGIIGYLIQPKGWSLFAPKSEALKWRMVCVVLTCVPDVALLSLGPYGPFRPYLC